MSQTVCFGIGSSVLLSGLSKRPELNTQVGRVLRYLPRSGRYSVRLSAERVSVKPGNLQLVSTRSGDQASTLLTLLPLDQLLKVLSHLPVRR